MRQQGSLALAARASGPAEGENVSQSEIAVALGHTAPNSLRALLGGARRSYYEQRDILYHQGGVTDSVFFITRGLLKLVIHLRNGRARIVRLHRPGAVLGLSGVLRQDYEHTAVGITPVAALRLPLRAVQRLRTEDPTTYLTLVERWHEYLEDADRWITHFSTGAIRARVARLVVFLSEFEPCQAGGQVQLLTCEEMGSILGVTSESVSRIIADFKRRNIIAAHEGESGSTYRVDLDRLRDITED